MLLNDRHDLTELSESLIVSRLRRESWGWIEKVRPPSDQDMQQYDNRESRPERLHGIPPKIVGLEPWDWIEKTPKKEIAQQTLCPCVIQNPSTSSRLVANTDLM
jgi:hypothetical protein